MYRLSIILFQFKTRSLPSLGTEMSLNIMLFCSKCWRKVLMGACDVSQIICDKKLFKMFPNNSQN